MLADPLFKGKDDSSLTRLAQYKLLEAKQRDRQQAGAEPQEFLRKSNIRVIVEYDVAKHLDRAVELINRTNQLNFTKKRLPEDLDQARQELLTAITHHQRQAGLIRVVDNYGDYGFVGFFLKQTLVNDSWLIHYCWSCRTLGMDVESWFYQQIGRPRISVSGEVLVDISKKKDIDWIALGDAKNGTALAKEQSIPEIRIVGGCEANAIGHYLGQSSDKLYIYANFASAGMYVRVNSSALVLSASQLPKQFAEEAKALQISEELIRSRYLDPAPPASLFVFSAHLDVGTFHYVHRQFGWRIKIEPDGLFTDLIDMTDEKLDEYFEARSSWAKGAAASSGAERIRDCIRHIRENYTSETNKYGIESNMTEVLSRIPVGGRVVLLVPGTLARRKDGMITSMSAVNYRKRIEEYCKNVPFVRLIFFDDCIETEAEILQGFNHYDRMVYYRLAQAILKAYDSLPGKKIVEMSATSAPLTQQL
jgi:hypothetical protein